MRGRHTMKERGDRRLGRDDNPYTDTHPNYSAYPKYGERKC